MISLYPSFIYSVVMHLSLLCLEHHHAERVLERMTFSDVKAPQLGWLGFRYTGFSRFNR